MGATSTDEVARIGSRGYLAIGSLSGLVGFVFLPIILGPIAVLCGIQLWRRHSEWWGLAMVGWGGASLVIGWLLGLLWWSL